MLLISPNSGFETMLKDYQRDLIDTAMAAGALSFGEFTLKSGRASPYFFNAGNLSSGAALLTLGRSYARTILEAELQFDQLFGPAYKGIPLAAMTAAMLSQQHGREVPLLYNRKEIKRHGEGGVLVGGVVPQRVCLVDDVITAGTAIAESVSLLEAHGGRLVAVVVALDRQEPGSSGERAVVEMEQRYGVPVISILKLEDLLRYLQADAQFQVEAEAIAAYKISLS